MFLRLLYKIIFGFMLFGSVNCSVQATNKVEVLGTTEEILNKLKSLNVPIISAPSDTSQNHAQDLSKITVIKTDPKTNKTENMPLNQLNPGHNNEIVIATQNQSIYVVFKVSTSKLANLSNFVSEGKKRIIGKEAIDSNYISVEKIYLLSTEENEMANLVYLLDLLSLRYPKTSNENRSTLVAKYDSKQVSAPLANEICEILQSKGGDESRLFAQAYKQVHPNLNHKSTKSKLDAFQVPDALQEAYDDLKGIVRKKIKGY